MYNTYTPNTQRHTMTRASDNKIQSPARYHNVTGKYLFKKLTKIPKQLQNKIEEPPNTFKSTFERLAGVEIQFRDKFSLSTFEGES